MSFTYRSIGSEGDPWPQWIRDLRKASGVYVIKQHGSNGQIVYVGSSVGRLYDTLTRHFQSWRRSKKYWVGRWQGFRGEGHDPGMTYPRGRYCVAVQITSKDEAKVLEGESIRRLRPRDNLVKDPAGVVEDDEHVPF